jgi:hypothetical protein
VLASLEGVLRADLADGALETEHNLLGGLGLQRPSSEANIASSEAREEDGRRGQPQSVYHRVCLSTWTFRIGITKTSWTSRRTRGIQEMASRQKGERTDLLVEDGLGLTSETRLLSVITALS